MGKIYYNGVDYSTPVVSGVSGIKGNAETTYRTGNVNITPANIGLGNVNNTADSAKSVKYAATAGSATPVAHASTATTYGKSTGSNYGHTKLSDTYTSSVGDASSGVAASQKALFDAYSTLNSNIDYFHDETAVCLYTTKSWSIGSGGYRWVCPSDGLYFLTSFFYFVDPLNVNEAYQFQMKVGEFLLAIYGGTDSWESSMNSRMISALVPLRQGEVITPYVHISRENVRFGTKLYYCRIINK
jgi:hypothetical protein